MGLRVEAQLSVEIGRRQTVMALNIIVSNQCIHNPSWAVFVVFWVQVWVVLKPHLLPH